MDIFTILKERYLCYTLSRQARKRNVCSLYQSKLDECKTIDDLLELFCTPAAQEYFCQHNWPSIDFILKHATKERLERHNIYIDTIACLDRPTGGFFVVRGHSKVVIKPKDWAVYRFFIYDTSIVEIDETANLTESTARYFVEKYDGALFIHNK